MKRLWRSWRELSQLRRSPALAIGPEMPDSGTPRGPHGAVDSGTPRDLHGAVQGWAAPARQATAQAPGGTREGQVRHRGQSRFVLTQGQEQMGDPVALGETGIRNGHAIAEDPLPPGGDEDCARLSDQPDAELTLLENEPGLGRELAGLVTDEVAEQAQGPGFGAGHGLGRVQGGAALHPDDARSPCGVELRDTLRRAP
jgi:hypothetical protein